MKTVTTYRQGDVLLKRVGKIPDDALRQEKNGPIILALGEVTGHSHAVVDDLGSVDVFVRSDGTMYLAVKGPVDLAHEEHGVITLPRGNYERVIQREYSPEEIRNVAD